MFLFCFFCWGAMTRRPIFLRGGGAPFIPPSVYGGHSLDACLLKRDQQ